MQRTHERTTQRMGLASSAHVGGGPNSAVIEVDSVSTLAPYVASQRRAQPVMVLFYAPWCPHCTHFFPAFQRAADQLRGTATLVAVNASNREAGSAAAKVAQQHEIRSFPTILVYERSGKAHAYTGARDAASIVKHMRQQA